MRRMRAFGNCAVTSTRVPPGPCHRTRCRPTQIAVPTHTALAPTCRVDVLGEVLVHVEHGDRGREHALHLLVALDVALVARVLGVSDGHGSRKKPQDGASSCATSKHDTDSRQQRPTVICVASVSEPLAMFISCLLSFMTKPRAPFLPQPLQKVPAKAPHPAQRATVTPTHSMPCTITACFTVPLSPSNL